MQMFIKELEEVIRYRYSYNIKVTIKIYEKYRIKNQVKSKNLEREIKILKLLKHINVI